MKKLDVPQSGSQADTTASRNRFGQYNRTRAMPTQPRTDAQVAVRGQLTDASQAWRELTDLERTNWNAFAATRPLADSLGQTIFLTGHQSFVSFWISMWQAGLTTPPDVPVEAPPVVPFIDEIACTNSITTMTLQIMGLTGIAVGQPVAVFCSPPVSPGVTFNGDYRFIQTKTALTTGFIDVGAAYAAKFGIPPVGRKIFVRCVFVTAEGGASGPAERAVIVDEA